jgi:transposase
MMSDLFWLTDEQMARLQPFFPRSHGRPRVDDRRVLSGIIFINRNALRWRAPWVEVAGCAAGIWSSKNAL